MQITIQCRNCRWVYFQHPHWECTCGQQLDAFQKDKSCCPSCDRHWTTIQCPKCSFPLPKELWLGNMTTSNVETSATYLKVDIEAYNRGFNNIT